MDTKGEMDGRDFQPQQRSANPERWERDLDPDRLAGQNIGPVDGEREVPLRTAYDVKVAHRALDDFTDDELRQVPILEAGSRLQQGATYVDLVDASRESFRATGDMIARETNLYVPKDRVPYALWSRIIGEEHGERAD
jgi:hypothetical protein